MLRKNCAPYPQITLLCVGLWSEAASLSFRDPEAGSWAFQLTEAGANGRSVPVNTVDHFLDLYPNARNVLVKLDIEGAEEKLFQPGSARWIDRINRNAWAAHRTAGD